MPFKPVINKKKQPMQSKNQKVSKVGPSNSNCFQALGDFDGSEQPKPNPKKGQPQPLDVETSAKGTAQKSAAPKIDEGLQPPLKETTIRTPK